MIALNKYFKINENENNRKKKKKSKAIEMIIFRKIAANITSYKSRWG